MELEQNYLQLIQTHSHSRTKLRLNPLDFLKSQTKRKKGEESGDEQNEVVKRVRESPELKSFLEKLPLELLWQVGLDLGYPSVIDLCQTSSTLEERLCGRDAFWAFLTKQEWNEKAPLKYFPNSKNPWRKRYRYFIERLPRKSDLDRFLEYDPRITELNLWVYGNKIGSEGAKAIAEALKENNTLTKLDLNENKIGSEGAKAFAEALKENNTLTVLYLRGNDIGSDGVKAIAEVLKENNTLTKLDLDFNNIGDEGAKAIAEALKENSTLTFLILNRNDIGTEGAKAIAEALKENNTLTVLGLWANNIGLPIGRLMRYVNKTVSIFF